jgi:hypothetical protein
MQILEHCQGRYRSYLVLEDDAVFRDDFDAKLEEFMRAVPADWQQIYLGGQLYHTHSHRPERINDLVLTPFNVNRTHAFAVHELGYEPLYRHLNQTPFAQHEHIDHHLGRLHESRGIKVYVPARWLVGQDGGASNISGKTNGATYWEDPGKCSVEGRRWQDKPVPAVFLESSIEVAIELERRGWHRGKWQSPQRLDNGVCQAIASLDVKAGLTQWFRCVQPEAIREGLSCVCLFHPSLHWECVKTLSCAKFHRIVADSADDAERQLEELRSLAEAKPVRLRRRNLMYFVWPKKEPGAKEPVWRWNVGELLRGQEGRQAEPALRRIDQFDGVRSVAIAVSDDADSVEEVKKAFEGVRIDNWIIVQNDPKLGGVAAFPSLLATMPRDESISCYMHAKGVKHGPNENIRTWASIMYEVCLDSCRFVDASIDQYPTVGPFKNTREYKGQMKFGWHFSGTFWWVRNDELFKRDWQSVPGDYYGSEKYLGNLFRDEEAGSLFGGHVGWLYHVHEMNRVKGMLEVWRKNAAPIRREDVVPVYINARNLLAPLRRMVDYLMQIPTARPIIVDNDSAWKPLLDYYRDECPCEVVLTGVNGGKLGWAKHMLNHAAHGIEKYVVTDPDLFLDGIPLDVLEVLSEGLDANPGVKKVGLSMDLESIDPAYRFAQQVKLHEGQFWRSKQGRFWQAGVDTTFAMRRAADPIDETTWGHLRTDRPYTAIHWPWQWTQAAIDSSEEIQFYLRTSTSGDSHWTEQMRAAVPAA